MSYLVLQIFGGGWYVEALVQQIYTVIRFLRVSAKFGTCTVVSVNGTLVEAKLCTFTLEYTHFIFNMCPIYTHDGASAKFSINSHKTDYSVVCAESFYKFIKEEASISKYARQIYVSGVAVKSFS